MLSLIRLKAPAKINLALDILGRRDDGYHSMKMVMQTISLSNQITVKPNPSTDEITITCTNPDVPCDERNFCHKAARLFFESVSLPPLGLEIDIRKAIPMEAGLAGGSTDAAAVLVALNQICATELSEHQLCDIGLKVGADVPFCITGGTTLTEGIGELLTPLPSLPHCHIVVAKPEESMKTGECFARFDTLTPSRRPDIDALTSAIASQDLGAVSAHLCNVFEDAVTFESIDTIKKTMLDCGALGCCMTGSGTAVFALFDNNRPARRCLHRLMGQCKSVFLAHPVQNGAAAEHMFAK